MHDLEARLRAALARREREQTYRRRETLDTPQCAHPVLNGQPYVAFSSNDYLGLANHPALRAACAAALDEYGVGSGAAHLTAGHMTPHRILEDQVARFTGRERALVFSTGYMANLAVCTVIAARGAPVYTDRLSHASILDGITLSRARLHRYPHANPAALEAMLKRGQRPPRLLVTDGVFSMDGDVAPLSDLARLATEYGAWLSVDDAHGIGVLGSSGRGSLEEAGLHSSAVPILVGTFGKALGTFGAFVAGSAVLIDSLIQFARPYVYTTALPPALAAATSAALKLVRDEPWRRDHLRGLVRHFREGAAARRLPVLPSRTPIQPVLVGGSGDAVAAARALRERGFLAMPIRPPTVPEGSARLRISITADHEREDLDRLLDALSRILLHRPGNGG